MIPFFKGMSKEKFYALHNRSNPFGNRLPQFYPKTTRHCGADWVVPAGTEIVAPVDGESFASVWSAPKGWVLIFLFEEDGVTYGLEFCHLKEKAPTGPRKQGQTIAISGNTGSATTGAHCHVVGHLDGKVTKNYQELRSEQDYIRMVKEGKIFDPLPFVKKRVDASALPKHIA